MSYTIPSDTLAVGNPNPPADMSNVADMLGLDTRALALLVSGSSTADPGGNTANTTAVQNFVAAGVVAFLSASRNLADLASISTALLNLGLNLFIAPSGDTTGATDTANFYLKVNGSFNATSSGGTFTAIPSAFTNGTAVVFSSITGGGGTFSTGTTYYVVSASGYTFGLAATAGGAAITPSSAVTASALAPVGASAVSAVILLPGNYTLKGAHGVSSGDVGLEIPGGFGMYGFSPPTKGSNLGNAAQTIIQAATGSNLSALVSSVNWYGGGNTSPRNANVIQGIQFVGEGNTQHSGLGHLLALQCRRTHIRFCDFNNSVGDAIRFDVAGYQGPVTYNATVGSASSTFTATGSAFTNGQQVTFTTIVSSPIGTATNFSTYTPYYVVSASGTSFSLSLTSGGAAIVSTGPIVASVLSPQAMILVNGGDDNCVYYNVFENIGGASFITSDSVGLGGSIFSDGKLGQNTFGGNNQGGLDSSANVPVSYSNGVAGITAVNSYVSGQVLVWQANPPAPFALNTPYYVMTAGLSANGFQLSGTGATGSVITPTATGTGTVNGAVTGYAVKIGMAADWIVEFNHMYNPAQGGFNTARANKTRVTGNACDGWGGGWIPGTYIAYDAGQNGFSSVSTGVANQFTGNAANAQAPANSASIVQGFGMTAASGGSAGVVLIGNAFNGGNLPPLNLGTGVFLGTQSNTAILYINAAANQFINGTWAQNWSMPKNGLVYFTGEGYNEYNNYDTQNPVPATYTNGTNNITGLNNFVAGDQVVWTSGAPGNFTVGVPYYVISGGLAGSHFQLSATAGGSVLTPNSSSTNVTASYTSGNGLINGTNTFTAGQLVVWTATSPSGFTNNVGYYVLSTNLTSGTFKLAATPGGAVIQAGSTGSGTVSVPGLLQQVTALDATGQVTVPAKAFNASTRIEVFTAPALGSTAPSAAPYVAAVTPSTTTTTGTVQFKGTASTLIRWRATEP